MDNLWERLQRVGCILADFHFSNYVSADSDIQSRETVTEESILEKARSKNLQAGDKDEVEESTARAVPTQQEALCIVDRLHKYVQAHDSGQEQVLAEKLDEFGVPCPKKHLISRNRFCSLTIFLRFTKDASFISLLCLKRIVDCFPTCCQCGDIRYLCYCIFVQWKM